MSELVDAFLKHKGFVRERGCTDAPLMPNVLADSLYLCWDEFLKGRLKKESKMWANRMIEKYRKFNKDFFAGFDKEQIDKGVDMMDAFSEFTYNERNLFKYAVKNRLKDLSWEQKDVISNIAACKFLASQANELWGIIYRTRYGEKDRDENLYGMYISARELLNVYTRDLKNKELKGIDLAEDQDIKLSMRRYEGRVVEFIRTLK